MKTILAAAAIAVAMTSSAYAGGSSTPNTPASSSITVQGQVFRIIITATTAFFSTDGGAVTDAGTASIPLASLPPAIATALQSGSVSPAIAALIASYF